MTFIEFADLRLPVGTRLRMNFTSLNYLQYPSDAILLGYLVNKGLMVRLPNKPPEVMLYDGMTVDVRLALQSGIVTFWTTLESEVTEPYPYLHLGWPANVTIEPLRKSRRYRFSSPLAAIVRSSDSIPDATVAGEFRDISLDGSRIALAQKLSDAVTQLDLSATLTVAGMSQALELNVQLKRRFPPVSKADDKLPFHYGVEFGDPSPTQRLLLLALCHELQGNVWL